jgi:hypothetical protein
MGHQSDIGTSVTVAHGTESEVGCRQRALGSFKCLTDDIRDLWLRGRIYCGNAAEIENPFVVLDITDAVTIDVAKEDEVVSFLRRHAEMAPRTIGTKGLALIPPRRSRCEEGVGHAVAVEITPGDSRNEHIAEVRAEGILRGVEVIARGVLGKCSVVHNPTPVVGVRENVTCGKGAG